jgi:hypothetical protein
MVFCPRMETDGRRLLIALYRRTRGDQRLLVNFREVQGLHWKPERARAASRHLLERGLARGEVVGPVDRPAGWIMLTPAGSVEAERLLAPRRRPVAAIVGAPRTAFVWWWARIVSFLSGRIF